MDKKVKTKDLTFGEALEAVKKDELIAREGWNGKNMFVFQRPKDNLSAEMIIDKVKSLPQKVKDYYIGQFAHTPTERKAGIGPADTYVVFHAYLCMKSADGDIINGWLASQTDMLAIDWKILP